MDSERGTREVLEGYGEDIRPHVGLQNGYVANVAFLNG